MQRKKWESGSFHRNTDKIYINTYDIMMVQLFLLSETRWTTLDYIPIDRSDRNLSDDGKKHREKCGKVDLFKEILRIISCAGL